MDFLARREYGRKELQSRLERAGFDHSEIEEALDGLSADGLQSDERFAEGFVRHRAGQYYGPLRIRAELRSRGVDAAIVDHHLQAFEGDWFERAEAACRRRFGETPIDSLKDRAKRFRYLSGRGFDHEQIAHAVARCCGDSTT